MNHNEIVARFALLAAARLEKLGFQKRRGDIYTTLLATDVVGWIGLNRARRGLSVEINPVLGVRNEQIEKRVSELLLEKPHPLQPPTISVSLGYLTPAKKYEPVLLTHDSDITSGAATLFDSFELYGVPFMTSCVPLRAIIEHLRNPLYASLEHSSYRIPIGYLLAGDSAGARLTSSEYCLKLGDRTDPAAERYRRFASALGSIIR